MNREDNAHSDLAYTPSQYSKLLNHYSKYRIKFILPFLIPISKTCPFTSHYPVYKLMKAIAKLLMLNEIQVIFLAYLIKETNWEIRDKTILMNAENVQDIVCYAIDNPDYKRLILYLMVTSFTVKYYLNDSTSQLMEQAGKKCPNFKQIFQNWAKKNSNITKKINPRTLNIVYKQLFNAMNRNCSDFNMMVDAIIQISPAYNPDKQSVKQEKKKIAKVIESVPKKQQIMIKHEKSGFVPANPLFSSSGLLGLTGNRNGPENSSLNPFTQKNNQGILGMMGSSVVGDLKNYQIKDQDDCEQLMIGLQNGQSQEHINFEQRQIDGQQAHYTSVISLNMNKSSLVDRVLLEEKPKKDGQNKTNN